MTKKFWADWQNRFGETYEVLLKYKNNENGQGILLFYPDFQKIVKATFNKETVTITLETKTTNWCKSTGDICYKTEIKDVTIHRKEIKTVKFRSLTRL